MDHAARCNVIPCLIVGYKNPESLRRCRMSIGADGIPFVWDNSENNIGLTEAVNQLISKALWTKSKYVIWLNQDVQLLPGTIKAFTDYMDAHPLCAVAGCKQLQTDQPDNILHGGTTDFWPGGKHLGGSVKNGDCNVSGPMNWINMAACCLRIEALRELGLFDERYFLAFQDSDFCLRAWLSHKWEVHYCAEAVVLHDKGGVSSSPSPEQLEILAKDQAAFSEKWASHANNDAYAVE